MLRRGDIVMTAAGTIGKTLLYDFDEPACYAGYLVRFRPGPEVDGRFIAYWMESHPYWDQIALGKVMSTIENFSASKYQNLLLRVPELAKQRAIADYLEAETARIDALIEKRQRMVELLEERYVGQIEEAIGDMVGKWNTKRLKFVVRTIEVGIVITPAAWYADEGVIALRGLNVKAGHLDLDDVVQISDEGHRLHAKSVLHTGDVVVVRTGQAGAACVVPETLSGCNCIDLVIVRKGSLLLPKFLEFVLNSDWAQKHIDEFSVGTIQSHFNVGAMKELLVPVPPLPEQEAVVLRLQAQRDELFILTSKLSRQIALLQEHRQALITAAVAGEVELPVVAA
jgi:type I restriction enzyme S subunit